MYSIVPSVGLNSRFGTPQSNESKGKVDDPVSCPSCRAQARKSKLDRAWETKFDEVLGKPIRQMKRVPVLVLYEADGVRHEKIPDDDDLALIQQIEDSPIPYWYPTERMPDGEETRRNDPIGMTHIHHFFTKRNLWTLACAWQYAQSLRERFLLTSLMYKSSLLCAPLMSNYCNRSRVFENTNAVNGCFV